MKVELTASEIEVALRDYIANTMCVCRAYVKVNYDFATRGYTADIAVTDSDKTIRLQQDPLMALTLDDDPLKEICK